MKFEVTMLPVHSTDYLNCCLARGYRYTVSSHSPLSRNMMSYVKLRTYVSMRSNIIKQEVKLSSVVCPYEGFKSMGVKVIKTQEMCKL